MKRPRWQWLFKAAGIFSLAVSLVLIGFSLTRPYVGADVSEQGGSWTVASVDTSGLAGFSGIRVGDTVVSVNGADIRAYSQEVKFLSGRTIRRLEVLNRQGTTIVADADSTEMPPEQMMEVAAYSLIGLAFWLVSAYVFMRRPQALPAKILFLLGSLVMLGLASVLAQVRNAPFALELEFVCLLLVGPVFAHMFLVFPVDKTGGNKLALLMYLPSAVAMLLLIIVVQNEGEMPVWFRVALLPIFTVGMMLGLGSLIHSSISARYVRIRQQARIVMAGSFVGVVPFILLSALPYMAWQKLLVQPQLSIVALVALPSSIGYALIKHQLMDIDLIVRRGVVYGLMSALIAAAFLVVILVVNSVLGGAASAARWVALVFLSVIALVTYAPIRDRIQAAVDRRFYKDRYDYKRVVSSLSSSLASMTDLDEIAHYTTASVSQVLGLSGACLLLHDSGGHLHVKSSTGELEAPEAQASLINSAGSMTEENLFPYQAPPASSIAFLVPLRVGNVRLGFLALGQKSSRQEYSVDDLSFLFTFCSQAATAIENARLSQEARNHRVELLRAYEQLKVSADELGKRKRELEDAYLGMARTLVLTLESRDPYTRGHSDRVSRLAFRIGRALGLSSEDLQKLDMAARLHDIGKTGIADAVLLKEGALGPSERAEIEHHPTRAVELLRFLDFTKDILPIIEYHHEWYNGGGYPRGLKGEDIPLGGRILSVVDAYDAMVSKRPYRPALLHEEAIRRLKEGAGKQWDPAVVQAFTLSGDLDQA